MQPSTPAYPDYLLKQARKTRRLTVQQVATKTGIAKDRYEQMESGDYFIDTTEAELLGALLKIKPQYIIEHNRQLQFLYAHHAITAMHKKKIAALTKTLKRKIKQETHANNIHP